MPDDISDIQKYYDNTVEQEDGRLERHQLERDITWRYLDKYLPARGRILEIGAATGVYTIPLAKRGYSITAVDLSPGEIGLCKKKIAEVGLGDKVTCHTADARDLSGIPGKNFDVVLLMGPLYHLVLEEDRKKALEEVYKRLKSGGVLFSAFATRYGIWREILNNVPHLIESQADVWSVIQRGKDSDHPSPEIGFRGYFAKVAEVKQLLKKAGFKKLVLAGMEPVGADDQRYKELQGKRRQLWLDLFFAISTEETAIGASSHLLYIGKKEG